MGLGFETGRDRTTGLLEDQDAHLRCLPKEPLDDLGWRPRSGCRIRQRTCGENYQRDLRSTKVLTNPADPVLRQLRMETGGNSPWAKIVLEAGAMLARRRRIASVFETMEQETT